MAYLNRTDLLAYCAAQDLQVLSPAVQGQPTALTPEMTACVNAAVAEARTHLEARYDCDVLFAVGTPKEPLLVEQIAHIALYKRHFFIEPRNIPDLRVKGRDDAIALLKSLARGTATAPTDWPRTQPQAGYSIQWGHDYNSTTGTLPRPDLNAL